MRSNQWSQKKGYSGACPMLSIYLHISCKETSLQLVSVFRWWKKHKGRAQQRPINHKVLYSLHSCMNKPLTMLTVLDEVLQTLTGWETTFAVNRRKEVGSETKARSFINEYTGCWKKCGAKGNSCGIGVGAKCHTGMLCSLCLAILYALVYCDLFSSCLSVCFGASRHHRLLQWTRCYVFVHFFSSFLSRYV